MKFIRSLFLLLLPFHFYLNAQTQIAHSPVIDSLIQEIDFNSLMLLNRQLTGDTCVVVNGVTDTIHTRHSSFPDNALAAQFILEKFQSFGLDSRFMNYDDNGQNVIATKTGTVYPDQQVIICAHYDNLPAVAGAPGSDDNASGVCAVLEAARIVQGLDFPYTLKFIAFDEEEQGLVGSAAYVDSAFYGGDDILAVLNLDMIAWDSDNDDAISISANNASMDLLSEYIQCINLYQPELKPCWLNYGGSDHYRFWSRSYKAIHGAENSWDFNAYYHTIQDHFSNLNQDYFHRMVKVSIATFLSWGMDSRKELSHSPIQNSAFPGPRTVTLVAGSGDDLAQGENGPRLYYRLNDGDFSILHASSGIQDTFQFAMPGFPYGSKVSYYFAVQDSAGRFAATLPEAGKGINPPGNIAPVRLYNYYVLKDTSYVISAAGLPLSFNGYDTVNKAVTVSQPGRVLDVDVQLSISHTRAWDLDIFLVTPQGDEIELSTKNGYLNDHYTSTVFDDHASMMIEDQQPPFTGTYRPESPLALANSSPIAGNWALKVVNQGGYAGQLTAFSLIFRFADEDLYVDSSVPVSGDGLSWATAFRTISEAVTADPGPGMNVFIKPGIYNETLTITSNGQEIVPLTTGISTHDTNIIQFPPGTDLSGIMTQSHPGEYFAYLYRSELRNAGCYPILSANDVQDYIEVGNAHFLPGAGVAGDSSLLSCTVGRPVWYRKYSASGSDDRVVINGDPAQGSLAVLYVGDPVGTGEDDAMPANFNILDGLDLTGLSAGDGLRLQSSSFNVIQNSKIYGLGGSGIRVHGNLIHPASHNFIAGNDIYDIGEYGILVGMPEQPAFSNHGHFNHLIENDISDQDVAGFSISESAIRISEYNRGTLIRGNHIHDIMLASDGLGVLEIRQEAAHTSISGNQFRNISSAPASMNSVIRIHGDNFKVEAFNNILSDNIPSDGPVYAFHLEGAGTDSCRIVHNTIYHLDNGFLLEDYSSPPDMAIQNNILHINGIYFSNVGIGGRFMVSHNLYPVNPVQISTDPYYLGTGRQIGEVVFVDAPAGDFHLSASSSPAVGNGATMEPFIPIDPDRENRDYEDPDIGAYELEDKYIWKGTASTAWMDPSNWRYQQVPDSTSNVIIELTNHQPVLPSAPVILRGLIFQPGTSLHIVPGAALFIMEE